MFTFAPASANVKTAERAAPPLPATRTEAPPNFIRYIVEEDNRTGKFGGKVKATVKVEPELIGGVRIALGDQVIDASVRGKLNAMAVSLKN